MQFSQNFRVQAKRSSLADEALAPDRPFGVQKVLDLPAPKSLVRIRVTQLPFEEGEINYFGWVKYSAGCADAASALV